MKISRRSVLRFLGLLPVAPMAMAAAAPAAAPVIPTAAETAEIVGVGAQEFMAAVMDALEREIRYGRPGAVIDARNRR